MVVGFPSTTSSWIMGPGLRRGDESRRSGGMMCRRAQFRRLFPGKERRGLAGQRRQHQRNHVLEPLVPRLLAEQIAAEDDAERGAVGEIEEAERGEGNI